jgi:hypothetical protein
MSLNSTDWRGRSALDDLSEVHTATQRRHRSYLKAVEQSFGADIDYAQLQKIYRKSDEGERCYGSPGSIGCETRVIDDNPEPKHHLQAAQSTPSHAGNGRGGCGPSLGSRGYRAGTG